MIALWVSLSENIFFKWVPRVVLEKRPDISEVQAHFTLKFSFLRPEGSASDYSGSSPEAEPHAFNILTENIWEHPVHTAATCWWVHLA